MSGGLGRILFFCLGTGAALGCLFLLFSALEILLGAGKLFTAVLDLLFCVLCGMAVFLCALAVDHGRLRLIQILFQLLGAWSAVTALGPFTAKTAGALNGIFGRFAALFRKKISVLPRHLPGKVLKIPKKQEKSGQKAKKAQKNT